LVPARHIVVDGSNLATESRTTPSLAQLEGAVAELGRELPDAQVTVVVDASFAHRIDPSERPRFEQLLHEGKIVSPPAGAIGRGDAFLLRIAEKVNGVVLSNDSFQEFHGEHPWLFDSGRLIGATPVPGVGWIFVARTPVRGERSRASLRAEERAQKEVQRAIAAATKEAVAPKKAATTKAPPKKAEPKKAEPKKAEPKKSTAAKAGAKTMTTPRAVNDPGTFIAFVAEHRLGDEIEAGVEGFTSHGAVVRSGDLVAYAPLSGLGDPAPKSAREVLKRGERRPFVVTALDPYRRGVEVALPGVGIVSGRPQEETVAAVVRLAKGSDKAAPRRASAPKARRPVKEKVSPQKRAVKALAKEGGPRRSPRAIRSLEAPKVAPAKKAAKKTTPRRRSGAPVKRAR
jgi:hypothetical protein